MLLQSNVVNIIISFPNAIELIRPKIIIFNILDVNILFN